MRKLAKWALPVVLLNVGVASAAGPKSLPSKFVLSLDGKIAATLASVEGGALVGEVVSSHENSASPMSKKQLGNPTHEDLRIQLNLSAARPAYDWIDSAWTGREERKQAMLIHCDLNGKSLSDRQFDATLSEVTFPKLIGGAKAGGLLTLSLKPDSSSSGKGSAPCSSFSDSKKNVWPGNFRFELDGVDGSGVISVESFTVSTTAATGGAQRGADFMVRGNNSVTFPNLKLTVTTLKAADFEKWFTDFVVKGNNGDEREKSGAIIFEDALQKELARVTLGNVGISRFSLKSYITEQPAVYDVELYVESMRLSMDGAKPKPSEFTAQAAPTKVRPAKAAKKRKK